MAPKLVALSSFLLSITCSATAGLQSPYATPTFVTLSDSDWPSLSEWGALNVSVNGQLSALRPWAVVCYSSDPLFNEAACQEVISGYVNDTVRESNAPALLWANWESCGFNDSCSLDFTNPQIVRNQTCEQGSTPPYGVEVTSAEEISTVIRWAAEHKVKVTVKNTGHDYQGRSAGPSTLQIWTRNMKNLTFNPKFVPRGTNLRPVPAVTLQAGVQVEELYNFADTLNVSIVNGGCGTVGVGGGFFQGGGHAILSPRFGLAADNTLEVEIVTADGQIRTVNAAQDPDLFWAVRGGGGGSWGVVTSVTFATHPATAIGSSILTIQPNPEMNSSQLAVNFLNLTALQANTWLDHAVSYTALIGADSYDLFLFWPADVTSDSVLHPFFEELLAQSSLYNVTSNTTSNTAFSSIVDAARRIVIPFSDLANLYGGGNRLASRIVPRNMMTTAESTSKVAEAIWAGGEILNAAITTGAAGTLGAVPVLIIGDMAAATRDKSNHTGANPALYDGTWHVVYTTPWIPVVSQSTNTAVQDAIHAATGPLTELGVTGAYQNEGDSLEVDWQNTFFGSKYAQLSAIKQKYDPTNFFQTWKGVGSVEGLEAFKCYKLD